MKFLIDKGVIKKRRRHSILAFEMVRLDRAAAEPLHQQLYRQIRNELASGSFNNNSSRLPSSRALAADFGVSRFTVNLALSRLHAEGYLQSKIGSGTFISEPLPETFLSAGTARAAPPTERPARLSSFLSVVQINPGLNVIAIAKSSFLLRLGKLLARLVSPAALS